MIEASGVPAGAVVTITSGQLADPCRRLADETRRRDVVRRLWDRDPTLWEAGVADPAAVRDRLGWLALPETMTEEALPLLGARESAGGRAPVATVLLGMGGSSLGAEACRVAFDRRDFHVLDTTVPRGIGAVVARAGESSRFVVSSKSGTTLETLALADFLFAGAERTAGERAGERFIAITDPGTPLHEMARNRGFQRIWLNPPDVGGRFSVLSYFGLVPMALMGLDLGRVLSSASRMAVASAAEIPCEDNPAARLGILLAAAQLAGRDKLTIWASARLSGLADWIEQLVAESSGKGGGGLVPVSREPLGEPSSYGPDRLFVQLRLADDEADERQERLLAELEHGGAPALRVTLDDPHELGQEFLRWELAVAIAGALVGFNPFDEPDVAASKARTAELLAGRGGAAAEPSLVAESGQLALYADRSADPELASAAGGGAEVADWLRAHLARAAVPDYVALQAFLAPEVDVWHALQGLRALLGDRLGVATTVGWGPRYLHSTGQLHKGGPSRGIFVQLTAESAPDLAIPGRAYGFGALFTAQALGDLLALHAGGRRALRVHFRGATESGLAQLLEAVRAAIA